MLFYIKLHTNDTDLKLDSEFYEDMLGLAQLART